VGVTGGEVGGEEGLAGAGVTEEECEAGAGEEREEGGGGILELGAGVLEVEFGEGFGLGCGLHGFSFSGWGLGQVRTLSSRQVVKWVGCDWELTCGVPSFICPEAFVWPLPNIMLTILADVKWKMRSVRAEQAVG